ncbi:MAG: hypothetical protein ABGZ35_09425 [Planctomycetaceae bacterium]
MSSLSEFFAEKNEPAVPFPETSWMRERLAASIRKMGRAPDKLVVETTLYWEMQAEISMWRRPRLTELFGLSFEGIPVERCDAVFLKYRDLVAMATGERIVIMAFAESIT